MKRLLLRAAAALVLAAAGTLLTSFSRPLEPMTRITGRIVYPAGPAIPVTWWRVGLILGRAEEAPLTVGGVTYQNLIVYREPEVWMVDVPRNSGRHVVDPGPSLGFHIAVASYRGDLDWNNGLADLEVGREREFMREKGAGPETVPGEPAGRAHYRYRDPRSGWTADLTVEGPGEVPRSVELRDGTGPLVTLVYDEYRTGLPVDLGLFSEPPGVAFED